MKTVALVVIGVVVALLFLITFLKRREKARKKSMQVKGGIVKAKKQKDYSRWRKLFFGLTKIKPLRVTLYTLEKTYELMQPGDPDFAMAQSALAVGGLGLLAGYGIIFGILLRKDLYYYGCLFIAFTVVRDLLVSRKLARMKRRLQKSFRVFLENVRHSYNISGMIDDAIYDAMIKSDSLMFGHAAHMYDVITSDDIDLALIEFNETVPDDNMKTFMAICISSMENGDPRDAKGNPVFLKNLADLKMSIQSEILRETKRNGAYAGLSYMAIMPVFAIPAINQWAASSFPELVLYYSGGKGFISRMVIVVLGFTFYYVLSQLQFPALISAVGGADVVEKLARQRSITRLVARLQTYDLNRTEKTKAILRKINSNMTVDRLILRKLLWCAGSFAVTLVAIIAMHNYNRQVQYNLDGDVVEITGITKAYRSKVTTLLEDVFERHVGETVTLEDLQKELLEEWPMRNQLLAQTAAEVLFSHLEAYQSEIFHWQELLICFAIAAIGYNVPFLLLLYKKSIVENQQKDEVLRLQTITLMLMYLKNITTEKLLGWMVDFAVLFKHSIQDCLNSFNMDEAEALDTLSASVEYEPFNNLVQNLENADKVGIATAFDELESDRDSFVKQMDAEEEIALRDRAAMAGFLAMIPLLAVILGYLVIPFIMNSLGGMKLKV